MSTKYQTTARRGLTAVCWSWSIAAALVLMTGCVIDTTGESDVEEWIDQSEEVGEYSSELLTHEGPTGQESNDTESSRTSNPCGDVLGNGTDPDPEPWVGPPVTGGPPVADDDDQAKEPGQAP